MSKPTMREQSLEIDLKCAEDVVAPARQIRDELAIMVKMGVGVTLSVGVIAEWHGWLDTAIRRKDFLHIGNQLVELEKADAA